MRAQRWTLFGSIGIAILLLVAVFAYSRERVLYRIVTREGQIFSIAQAQRFMPFPIVLPAYLPPGYRVVGAFLALGPQGVPVADPERGRQVILEIRGRGNTFLASEEAMQVTLAQSTRVVLPGGRTVHLYQRPLKQGGQVMAAVWRERDVSISLDTVILRSRLSKPAFEKIVDEW